MAQNLTESGEDGELVAKAMALANAAAEGPWFVNQRPRDDGLAIIEDGREHGLFPITCEWHEAPLIAASRTLVPDLCARLSALLAERDGLKDERDEARRLYGTKSEQYVAERQALSASNAALADALGLLRKAVKSQEFGDVPWNEILALLAKHGKTEEAKTDG